MDTHLRALSESYPMNTNMTGFLMFFKILSFLVFWTQVASAAGKVKEAHPCTHLKVKSRILKHYLIFDTTSLK